MLSARRHYRRNPDRAGVVRHLVRTCGFDSKDAEKLVPKYAKGGTSRRALSEADLDVYRRAVKRTVADPVAACVLLLLPRTGLRIAEITRLQHRNVVTEGNRIGFRFVGKGQKERFVPLTRKALAILTRYPGRTGAGTPWLFPNARGTGPIPAARIQSLCRELAAAEPHLVGLTPHVLRHTYASMGLQRCQDMIALRDSLGHGKANSKKLPAVTLTYLHPDILDPY
jgi:integrase